ncbi:hypothetical protein K437DRAFT_253061 [Tilletiaria anomala UBC 951]|uniref:Uncharacterized protein n=1 Tax=Tilletiaria anomala (strain ATCC 24038 / CBS 436.72 / UBC 951) TaxID=1037660 RepID=A0A066WLC8_TILAU|nr:uncharacterized protein K437DRAFT_253061 [Tilletiaria anomala UBC 951]KDN53368.1 hypothetical protein K437DRAFT_253061 [Tilletiaria anomala UBC 951]
METHLAALNTALTSIHDLHARTAHGRRFAASSTSGPSFAPLQSTSLPTLGREHFPFTKAVLNPGNNDILDFIRDANHLEASLFWYPPAASSSEATSADDGGAGGRSTGGRRTVSDAHGTGTSSNVAGAAGTLDGQLSVMRAPALRQAVPPTPLKPSSKDLESAGLLVWDAHTLLLTAQRLASGSGGDKFTRTRKHIKELLRKAGDVEKARKRFEDRSAAMEEAIRLGPEVHAKRVEEARNQKEKEMQNRNLPTHALLAKVKAMKAELQQEEMEVFALEEMKSELLEKQKRLMTKSKVKSAAQEQEDTTMMSFGESADDLAASIAGDGSQEFIGDTSVPFARSTRAASAKGKAGGRKSDAAAAAAATDAGPAGDSAPEEKDDDVTIRHEAPTTSNDVGSELEPHASEDKAKGVDNDMLGDLDSDEDEDNIPEATDELERVTEKIWSVFGDVVRFVAPEREGADFSETLKMLEVLIGARSPASLSSAAAGGGATAVLTTVAGSGGDTSVASSAHTGTSGATNSSAASGAAGSLPNAGPPTPTNMAAAHVLVSLLRTPEPHQLEFEDLRILTSSWWDAVDGDGHNDGGREKCRAMMLEGRAQAPESELMSGGETLAARAIYGLQAKKLLVIRRKGAKAPVGFAGL